MGKTHREQTAMLRTHGLNRDERAVRAIDTVNKVIPEHLRTSPRARHGIHRSVVIADPQPRREDSPNSDNSQTPWKVRISVKDTDTFSAARKMTYSSRRASISTNTNREQNNARKVPNVCVLNHASAIRPGGGFLDGVHSQEEFLCQRSTLYASLWDSLYPLPEYGGIFSSDILVFGDSTPEAEELLNRDRVFVDVISAAMIRFPGAARWRNEAGEEVRPGCSCGISYCDQDREVVMSKMRAVLRIAQAQGSERLVLGAWGCGGYANPPREVARLWKKAIFGTARSPLSWSGIKEIVFAITDRPALREFEKCFADVVNTDSLSPPPEEIIEPTTRDEVNVLITEIQETEIQLSQLQNPRTRGKLRDKLANLNKRLAECGKTDTANDDDEAEPEEDEEALDDDGFVVHGYPASDGEDNSYYNFDENDVASSGSETPASVYEFRFNDPSSREAQQDLSRKSTPPLVDEDDSFVHAIAGSTMASPRRGNGRAGPRARRMSSFEKDADERRRLDQGDGWFSGSVNELSALLRKTGGGAVGQNPALSPADTRTEHAAFPEF